jgi:hypothetical protein
MTDPDRAAFVEWWKLEVLRRWAHEPEGTTKESRINNAAALAADCIERAVRDIWKQQGEEYEYAMDAVRWPIPWRAAMQEDEG